MISRSSPDPLDIAYRLNESLPYLNQDDKRAARGLMGYYGRHKNLTAKQIRYACAIMRRANSQQLATRALSNMRRILTESDTPLSNGGRNPAETKVRTKLSR